MKWIFAFAIFVYPIAALREFSCDDPFETCVRPMDKLFDDLRTVEDVKNMCPKFIEYIACLGNFDETCGDKIQRKIFQSEGEFESVRDMIADICDENSLLHTVLMEKIQCLRDGLFDDDNNTCYVDREVYRETLSKSTSEDNSEYDEMPSADMCLFSLYNVVCYTEFVGNNCGTLTKDAVLEVLHRSFVLRRFCEQESAIELAEVIDKMELREPFRDVAKEMLHLILKKDK